MRVTPECDTLSSFEICNRHGIQTDPAGIFNSENYIVVWCDGRFIEYESRVVAARVTPAGSVLDTGYCVGAVSNQGERSPDIAFDNSRCLAVWFNYYEPFGVFGRFINDGAQPEDSLIEIAPTSINGNINPRLEFDSNNYLVVWADQRQGSTDFDIYGRLISPQGVLISTRITIATGPEHQIYPDLTFDGNDYCVVWREGFSKIYGQFVAMGGQLIGSNFQVSADTLYYRFNPGIATSNTDYCICWSEIHTDDHDIYGTVDIQSTIEEEEFEKPIGHFRTTIISGPISLPEVGNVNVYDISGRVVEPHQLSPGIYFIVSEGKITDKVIKIR